MADKPPRIRVERGLYRRGDVYLACVTPSGERKPRWRSLGRVGIMEARRMQNAFASEVHAGLVPATLERASVNELAASWLADQERLVALGELKQRTYDSYESAIRLHVKPALGSRLVHTITPDTLVNWHKDQRLGGASAWSIRARWMALRGVLGHAARHGYIAANPADRLTRRERPKQGSSKQRFLTREEMQAVLKAAVVPGNLARTVKTTYRAAIATGLFAGLRVNEILGLAWQDIDFDEGLIRVRFQMSRGRDPKRVPLKSDAGRRDVVLMPALAAVLKEHRLASGHSQPQHLVFSTRWGTPVGDRNLAGRGLTKACERAKLEGITFHSLRHTFASMLIAQGRDVVFVSRQLGHADVAITLRTYAHLFNAAAQAREARELLEDQYGTLLRESGS